MVGGVLVVNVDILVLEGDGKIKMEDIYYFRRILDRVLLWE